MSEILKVVDWATVRTVTELVWIAVLVVATVVPNRRRDYASVILFFTTALTAWVCFLNYVIGPLRGDIRPLVVAMFVLSAAIGTAYVTALRKSQRAAEAKAKTAADAAEVAAASEAERIEKLRNSRPDFHYCPNCATPERAVKLELREFNGKMKKACPVCPFVHWNNPREVVVVLVPAPDGSGRLVLVKRKIPPKEGFFALPGGFVDEGEGLEEAAIREVMEETGLVIEIVRFYWSVPIKPANQILTFYIARVVGGQLTNSNETDAVDYYSPAALPGEIAFPTHLNAIQNWAKEESTRA